MPYIMNTYIHFLHIQGGIGKGLSRMSDAIIEHVYAKTAPLLHMLGYELVSPEPESIGDKIHHTDCNSNSNNGNNSSSGYSIKLNPLTINELIHVQTAINNHRKTSHANSNTTTTSTNTDNSNSNDGVYINTPYSIRRPDDPFGRDFTLTRRRLTEDDRRPLPTATP